MTNNNVTGSRLNDLSLLKKLIYPILFIGLFLYSEPICSQENQPDYLYPDITFLSYPPKIDGVLDTSLATLPKRNFHHFVIKTNPANSVNAIHCRLAYGTAFLYVFIEVQADSFTCRDRGYQNGDGLLILLAKPHVANQMTDEFYLLGFYPVRDPENPFKKLTWYYNGELKLSDLSNCTFVVQKHNGKVGYEILLPWSAVYPYHPWISEAVGFNLFFVKAIGENEVNWHGLFLNQYQALQDNLSLYLKLRFQKPQLSSGVQSFVVIERNCNEGELIRAKIVTTAANVINEKIQFEVKDYTGKTQLSEIVESQVENRFVLTEHPIPVYDLPSADYTVAWRSFTSEFSGETGLTILPGIFFEDLYWRLQDLKGNISAGSYYTLKFYINDFEERRAQLKPYETSADLRKELANYLDIENKANRGEDVLAYQTGIFRRAYRSALDKSLWPYSVRIPSNFKRTIKYPLLIFLHGSDRDDQALAIHSSYISDDRFIQMAPHGRGSTNCYTVNEAQIDIDEAIRDVIRNYPIDTTAIILAGFSMGGYGVYRTFYETPTRFKALAVFSGQPDLASQYFPGESHPNFLNQDYLSIFNDIPIFIFHGKNDLNAPYELTEEVVSKLKLAGAEVTFITEEQTGHSPPNAENVLVYQRWLHEIINKKATTPGLR